MYLNLNFAKTILGSLMEFDGHVDVLSPWPLPQFRNARSRSPSGDRSHRSSLCELVQPLETGHYRGHGLAIILTVSPVDGSVAGGAGACFFFLHLWSLLG